MWTYRGLTMMRCRPVKQKLTNRAVSQLTPRESPYEVRDTEIKGFLLRVQPSGCMTYYFEYRRNDARKNRTLLGKHGTITPMQARDAASVQAGKVARKIDPQAEKKDAKDELERSEATILENFIALHYEPWASNHLKTGEDTVRRVKTCFPSLLNRKMADINNWMVESWRSKQSKEGKSPSTINRDIAALRSVLSKAVEWSNIDRHPLECLKPLKVDTSPKVRYLSPEEESRLREALRIREARIRADRDSGNEWRRARGYEEYPSLHEHPYADHLMPMVLLSLNTGMRRGEVFNLSLEDIDLDNGILTVVAKNTKSGKKRTIPLNDEAYSILSKLKPTPDAKGLVFPGKDGRPLNNVKSAWSKLLKDAEIVNFRWHDMRHHFASILGQKNANILALKDLLGHSNIKTTMCYAHSCEKQKLDAVNLLNQARSASQHNTKLRVV